MPFATDARKLYKIEVNFSKEIRGIKSGYFIFLLKYLAKEDMLVSVQKSLRIPLFIAKMNIHHRKKKDLSLK